MKLCFDCSTPTADELGVCDDCRRERTFAQRASQGLPRYATDDPAVAAWLGRLLGRSSRTEKAAS